MRATGCTLQQSLKAEAATVVKQSVVLAKRRGHAHVTPLHVASTMLSVPGGLLRTACLQSHSHPLQCKALELCFNVALNRLPSSSSSPMLVVPHSQNPSISNALIAAFKRAQAHQRRGGSVDNHHQQHQQPSLIEAKIEIEQLIISILDDPSVSRVMKEAGFSSTQVKTNLEQAMSSKVVCSKTQTTPSISKAKESNNLLFVSQSPSIAQIEANISKPKKTDQVRQEDVKSVIDNLMMNKRRKNVVIVGECITNIEAVVRKVMDRVEKGDVPEGLREVKFTSLPLFSFSQSSKNEVEQKFRELRLMVKRFLDKQYALYLGNLEWIAEYVDSSPAAGNFYCPVEHMIMEIGRLISDAGENGRFWMMGIANIQTYMKCRSRSNKYALETVWNLQPVIIPEGSLGLSLIPDCEKQCQESRGMNPGNETTLPMLESRKENKLTCCADCLANFQTEARRLENNSLMSNTTLSRLPSWLRDEGHRISNNEKDNIIALTKLCEKWNSICSSIHKHQASSERISGVMFEARKSWMDYSFWNSARPVSPPCETSLRLCIPEHSDYPLHEFSSTPNSTPNSASSSDAMEMEYVQRFKEFNTENLNALCTALERKVPWQKDIIPEIAGTVLKCRSRMFRRKENHRRCGESKEETWLFFQGADFQTKEKLARELAKVIFGSHSSFVSIVLSSFSSTRADSFDQDFRNKRGRDEQSCSYIEKFADAVSANPHRVFLAEDVEQADYSSQMGIKRAIERGIVRNSNDEEVSLSDAIVILSCESFSSRSSNCSSPPVKQRLEGLEKNCASLTLDLNMSIVDDFDANNVEYNIVDGAGLLECVDRCIMFQVQ